MESSLIHYLSYLSLFAYLLGSFQLIKPKFKSLLHPVVVLGLLSHFLILILVFNLNLALTNESILFTLSPSWVILLSSMFIMFSFVFTEEGSPYHAPVFYWFSVLLLLVSIYGFHSSSLPSLYVLQPLLFFHIVVSILSQFSVYFVFCLSILVLLLNRMLKKKSKLIGRLPSLLPTQKLLQSGEYIAFLLLLSSIISGLFIVHVEFKGLFMKFVFSCLFLLLLALSIICRKYLKFPFTKVNLISVILWSVLLSIQTLYKLNLI